MKKYYEEKYNISMVHLDSITTYTECYTGRMTRLILKMHGNDFYDRVEKEAIKEFEKIK